MMMGRCNSGWHHIDSPAALRVSCHFTAGDLLGCTVAAFTERHPAFRLSISAGGGGEGSLLRDRRTRTEEEEEEEEEV